MKYKDLIKEIKKHGGKLLREGGNHEIWSNGEVKEAVPRHREINEKLANRIIKSFKESKK